MVKNLTIGYTCNVRPPELEHDPKYSEWADQETIDAVTKAFEGTGNRVILVDADKKVYETLSKHKDDIDIVFNDAEGLDEGEMREAIVPFCCEFLGIPYTASGPGTMINTLNKARAKDIFRGHGVRTPDYQVMKTEGDPLDSSLQFPLMVKPIMEGSSMGITQKSRVTTPEDLRAVVKRLISEFSQPVLVEEFLDGKEYSVWIIGNYVLPIMGVDLAEFPGNPLLRDASIKTVLDDAHLKLMPSYGGAYLDLARQTAIAFDALSCRDYARMDFREGSNGKVFLLEINALPYISPRDSTLAKMSEHAGLTHTESLHMMLYEAILRYQNQEQYKDRFSHSKVSALKDFVEGAKGKLCFYNDVAERFQLVKAISEWFTVFQ